MQGRVRSSIRVIYFLDKATISADRLTDDGVPSDSDETGEAFLKFKFLAAVYHRLGVTYDPVQVLLLSMDHDHIGPLTVEQLGQVFLNLSNKFVGRSGGHDRVNSLQRQVLPGQLLLPGDVDVVMRDDMLQELLEDWFVARLEMDVEVLIRRLLILGRALRCPVDQDEYVRTAKLAHAFSDRNNHVVV